MILSIYIKLYHTNYHFQNIFQLISAFLTPRFTKKKKKNLTLLYHNARLRQDASAGECLFTVCTTQTRNWKLEPNHV